ncbi:MAG TPA: endolytic transglycosylase MltG [Gemmatimonadales bacterium]|nr:endolytic transglycosylase MltG [Gemmatimonadales bacterium]
MSPGALPRALGGAALVTLACTAQPHREPEILVTIPRGATFDAAVESLTAKGVVEYPALFRVYARLHGLPGDLKSGIYRFRADESWGTVVGRLKSGRGVEIRFTVPEGLTLAEVADLAQAQLGIPRDSLLAAASDPDRLRELGIERQAGTLEGYLFPTTYLVPVGIRARELVRVMTREFLDRWEPGWDDRVKALGWTRHEAVTLASIIQSETRYAPDAPFVSAVYHNRLSRGMRLQADPTVVYALGRRVSRVYEKHLTVRSPYNTYLRAGLPPGPISQPGDQSLRAALFPAEVPFLYFVAQPDGKHVFSVTYAEHLRAIRAIRRGTARGAPSRR